MLRVPALSRYLDGLLDMLEKFRPHGSPLGSQELDEGFAMLFLIDCWVRVELTAETMTWPSCGVHLPCWETVLRQATSPEICG